MTDCPHCRRRLLSHASANCNWCGAVIGDSDYQAAAQAEREAYFVHQAERDAQSLANIDAISINSYDPFLDPLIPSPIPRTIRSGTHLRPLAYQNQPQVTHLDGQDRGIKPMADDRDGEDASSSPVTASTPLETKQSGRFQHLEL